MTLSLSDTADTAALTFPSLDTVFSKCATTMEEGKRLENLSWRLWSKEAFTCHETDLGSMHSSWHATKRKTFELGDAIRVPELSSSVESAASSTMAGAPGSSPLSTQIHFWSIRCTLGPKVSRILPSPIEAEVMELISFIAVGQ